MSQEFSKVFSIAYRKVGYGQPVFIVAEAGVAHFGSIEKAKALVDMAVAAKADAVKFQVFKTDELISKESPEWMERLRIKELPFEAFKEIQAYCREREIIFFATAHDEMSLQHLDRMDSCISCDLCGKELCHGSLFRKRLTPFLHKSSA